MIVSSRPFVTYLIAVAVGIAALSLPAFVLNVMVDPLWYGHGSRLSDENLAFDERLSKSNQFLKDPGRYDCLVLGSSRVTLLDARQIRGHTCFNYAFSDGRVAEYLAFARYAKARGMRPKLVITGVEEFQFRARAQKAPVVPDFVRHGTAPKPLWLTYLSMGALGFSIDSLRGVTTLRRSYDGELVCRLRRPRRVYDPPAVDLGAGPAPTPKAAFVPDNISLYRDIGQVFPDARYVGYVPPISLWRVGRFAERGTLDSYLSILYAASKVFDRMLDFSVPSPITADKARTVDGSHYEVAVNDRVAAMLSGAPLEFGLDVTALSQAAYERTFKAALRAYAPRLKD